MKYAIVSYWSAISWKIWTQTRNSVQHVTVKKIQETLNEIFVALCCQDLRVAYLRHKYNSISWTQVIRISIRDLKNISQANLFIIALRIITSAELHKGFTLYLHVYIITCFQHERFYVLTTVFPLVSQTENFLTLT